LESTPSEYPVADPELSHEPGEFLLENLPYSVALTTFLSKNSLFFHEIDPFLDPNGPRTAWPALDPPKYLTTTHDFISKHKLK